MDATVQQALKTDRTIDITTIGRKSGQPRRIEIWFHNIDNHIYITGTPGRRNWYANLEANSDFTFHLKESVQADLAAHARLIEDPAEKRAVLQRILANIDRSNDLEIWMARSPLVEVRFDDA